MKPIKDNVLVELDDRVSISKGGIHIPAISQTTGEWGTVEATGSECLDLSEGDRVLVLKTQGTHYIQQGKDMVILPEKKVLAIDVA